MEEQESVNGWTLLFGVIVLIIVFILFIHSLVSPNYDSNYRGYCNSMYGNESFYNHLSESDPYELRSCDTLENNTLVHNYFLYTKDYLAWQNKINSAFTCPDWYQLNKWSCWKD